MPTIVDGIMGQRTEDRKLAPRSVIPGRQRWDVGVVLGRPRVAELLEAQLRESPGLVMVYANPVTGRLLVYHDALLASEDIDQLICDAVLVVRQAMVLARS